MCAHHTHLCRRRRAEEQGCVPASRRACRTRSRDSTHVRPGPPLQARHSGRSGTRALATSVVWAAAGEGRAAPGLPDAPVLHAAACTAGLLRGPTKDEISFATPRAAAAMSRRDDGPPARTPDVAPCRLTPRDVAPRTFGRACSTSTPPLALLQGGQPLHPIL